MNEQQIACFTRLGYSFINILRDVPQISVVEAKFQKALNPLAPGQFVHHTDVIMTAVASQITSLTIV